MANKAKPMKLDKRDIVMIIIGAIISAFFSFGMWVTQEKIQESHEKVALVKQMRVSVLNDLKVTIPVAEGFYKNLLNDKVCTEHVFRIVYSPSVVLPTSSVGVLPESIVSSLDEYQRRYSNSLKLREEYLELLKDVTAKEKQRSCFIAYYITLDSVIRTGVDLIREIDKYFPEANQAKVSPPAYISMQELKNRLKPYLPGVIIE